MESAPFRSQLESTTLNPVNWTRAQHGATLSFPLARDRNPVKLQTVRAGAGTKTNGSRFFISDWCCV